MSNTMRAVVATRAGGPEVLQLGDLPRRQPAGAHEVLVRLKAASLNPADAYFRAFGPYIETKGPLVLGHDGAGIVEAVGNRVTAVAVGDAVCFCHGGIGGTPGTYAEFAVVPDTVLARLPAGMDFETAAALPLVAITLTESLYERADVRNGESVLIHAGAGGTGHIGIQLARLRGARVATTVSGGRKAALAEELGVDIVIPYRDRDFVAAVREWQAAGVDVALDNVGPEVMQRTYRAMAPYGRVVTLMGTPADTDDTLAYNLNLTIHNVMMLTPMWRGIAGRFPVQARYVADALSLLSDGKLKVVVDRVFPLAEAAEAHRYLESGQSVGKIVLAI